MQNIKRVIMPILAGSTLLITSCMKSNFNAYKHMTRIISMTSAEQFNNDKETILAHVDPTLRQDITDLLSVTIYDSLYSIAERDVHIEQQANTTKILADYECRSIEGSYTEIAYFVYVDDMLIEYSIQAVDSVADF